MNKEHSMKQISIDKITLNIGTGAPGDELEKSLKLLQKITNVKPVKTVTHKRIPTWGVRPGLTIGCKITLRGKPAEEVLTRLLKAVNNSLPASHFDTSGNFSFGIKEYLDIPGVAYDAYIGIRGLEVAVTLKRPGYRVKMRRVRPQRIGKHHVITKEDAIAFIGTKYQVKVEYP